jgi:predicted NAD/FAD-dependent oxidoreductase
MADPHKKSSVVIVGAGFAGFHAARELSRLIGTATEIGIDISRGDQRRVRSPRREPTTSLMPCPPTLRSQK